MDDKTAENLIEDALNSQKPDKSVLSAAKIVMENKKTRRQKHVWQFYAAASCCVILIALGVVFAIFDPINTNGFTTNAQAAMERIKNPDRWILSGLFFLTGIAFGAVAVMLMIKNKKQK